MPSSHFYQLNQIMELIIMTGPSSILDVGIGFGKYGFLCREYLDILDGRQKIDDWRRRIDGIEIFEKYITPLQRQIYDRIYLGDALDILPELEEKYDLILLIDIIEHFTQADGQKLLQLCRQRGRNIILSTPRIDLPQSAMFGNPYEKHRAFYRKRNFRHFADKFFVSNFFSLIVYLGADAQAVRKKLRRRLFFLSLPLYLGFKSTAKKALRQIANQMFSANGYASNKQSGDCNE